MKKRFLALLLVLVMVISLVPMSAFAATSLSYAPYAKIEYGYSSGVTCGTIRYISQITSNQYFNSSYWPSAAFGDYASPGSECGTACISMALSYIGINKTPKAILEAHNGTTYFGDNWGGSTYISTSLSTAISNYLNGNGKYSPVVICMVGAGSWNSYTGSYNNHYVMIAGKVNDSSYQIVDPANASVTTRTISGGKISYGSGSYTISQVHQWYNGNAAIPASTYTVTFNANGGSCSTSSKTVEKGAAIGTLPTPTKSGFDFAGWYTSDNGSGSPITTSERINGNTTLYAHWANKLYSTNKISFDAQGGSLPTYEASRSIDGFNTGRGSGALIVYNCGGQTIFTNTYGYEISVDYDGEVISKRAFGSEAYLTVRTDGFILSGHSDGSDTSGSAFITSNIDIGDFVSYNKSANKVYVYESRNGYLAENKYVATGSEYGNMPIPTRDGYLFDGWYTAAEGGSLITFESIYSVNKLYAHWTPIGKATPTATATYGDHGYALYDYHMTWDEAKAFCDNIGGHLVTITSAGEQKAVESMLPNAKYFTYFIGCSDKEEEGTWKWITGETFGYQNWDASAPEPNGGTKENFGAMVSKDYAPNKQVGEWNDTPNDHPYGKYGYGNGGFICEFDSYCEHSYKAEHHDGTCTEYGYTEYVCTKCGESYKVFDDEYSDWSITKPVGIDESLVETKTQYRSSDYETKTSYNATESGWTQVSSKWEQSGTGSVQYVKSWPSGFNTSNNLYSTYNKTPKSASETATAKTVINSDKTTGYIYYHWCRGEWTTGPINRATSKTKTSEFDTFHAFYHTTSPSGLTASPDGDGSYTFANSSCCVDSHWYYPINVYTQTYTTYKKLFTHERWTSWSAWDDTPITASSTKKVETQTLYRYINAELGEHVWNNGIITTPASCTADGVKTFTCNVCGDTRTESIKATGHNFVAGKCTKCTAIDPDYQSDPVIISVGAEKTAPGGTVMVPVYISNNIGFAGFTFEINYNKTAMTLTDITKGDVLKISESGMFTKNVAGSTINYTDSVDICSEGTLLYLTFAVNDNTAAGDYSISMALKDGKNSNFVNENSKSITNTILAGKVTVEKAAHPDITEGRIIVSDARARAGEEVTVSVSIEDNPGIMVMALGIDYDRTKLELVGFEDGIMTGWKVSKNAVWIGADDVTANGVILKLKFKVLENVEDGDIDVSMLFSEGDIANHNEEVIMPAISNGTITVYSHIPGDVTGDGKVNALDLVRLQRYLSGEDVAIGGSCDITGDGKINALDLVRLQRYLSGEDVQIH